MKEFEEIIFLQVIKNSSDGQIILNPSQSLVSSFLGSHVPEDARMSLIAQQTWKLLKLRVSRSQWLWCRDKR